MANLLPTTERKALDRERRQRFLNAIMILISGIFAFGIAALLPSLMSVLASRASVEERLEATKRLVALQKDAGASEELGGIKDKLDLVGAALGMQSPRETIEKVVTLAPSGIALYNIIFSRNNGIVELELSGIANSRASLLAFGDALKTSGLFANVVIPIESLAQNADLEFKLSLELKETPEL